MVMDAKLKYKEHIAMASTKSLEAVLELKRLRGLSPATARQLFTSTVAPVLDYASNVWRHAFKDKLIGPINRVQRIGAQAIVGTFLTVATSVAEAEAHIKPAQDRFWRRSIKLWTDIHTLPDTNPLRRNTARMRKLYRQHRSPLYEVADVLKDFDMEKLETINPFTLAPWEKRLWTVTDETAAEGTDANGAVRIAVSSSARYGLVGIGGAIQLATSSRSSKLETFSSTLGTRSQQNPYSGELAAIARALSLLPRLRFRNIMILTSNKAAVLSFRKPRQQSGQEYIRQAYDAVKRLRRDGNVITLRWTPVADENELKKIAKERAKEATRPGSRPQTEPPGVKSTILNAARAKRDTARCLPENVGKYSKRIDIALPGKHTRQLYDKLSRKEASVLAQLRTGMARLNGYLHRITAAPTDQCACGQAIETVEHFLFRCRKWTEQRTEMLQCTDIHRGNLSFYLGGKSPLDNEKWAPNMEAVRATIRFAMATGRLDADRRTT
jgi:ribonuclease HI